MGPENPSLSCPEASLPKCSHSHATLPEDVTNL